MGNCPHADLFFGITKWFSWNEQELIENAMKNVKNGNVTVEEVPVGNYDGDGTLVAAYWTDSRVDQGAEYDKEFDIPRFNEEMAAKEVIEAWKKMGLKIEKPAWHLIASYG